MPNPTESTRNYCYQANPNTHSQATKDAEGCAPFNATNFQHRLEAGPKKNGVGPASSFIVLCDGSFRDEHKTNGVHIRLAILVIMPDFHLDDGRGLSAACCLRYSFTHTLSLFPLLLISVCVCVQAIWPPHRVGQLVEACVKFLCLRRVSCQQTIKSFIFNAGTSHQATILSHCCSCVCVVSDFIISFGLMSSSAELLIKFPSSPSLHMPIENSQFRVLREITLILFVLSLLSREMCISLKCMPKSRQQSGSKAGFDWQP